MAASAKRLEKDTNRLEIDTNKLREALGENFVNLETIVNQVKGDALTLIHDAKSGHPGGCMAIVRPLLMYYALAHDNSAGVHLSGGHLAPVMYVLGHLFGTPETAITDEEMALFRTIEGLSGHADTRIQAVASGVLGQGAGVANGYALAERLNAKRENREERKTYVFIGDGEADEGAVFEAMEHAATAGLNVCYIFMHNKRNLSGRLVHDFGKKVSAFKQLDLKLHWKHNESTLLNVGYGDVMASELPGHILIIDTIKGEGISFMESHPNGYHGDPLPDDKYIVAMKELGLEPKTFKKDEYRPRIEVVRDTRVEGAVASLKAQGFGLTEAPTRKANEYLAELGMANDGIVVLIPDIGKSVVMDRFAKAFPERFFDVGIKEMTATLEAMGLSAKGYIPIVSTFDGFTHIVMPAARIADYSGLPLGFILTHGEFLGEDGPTHQITENLGSWLGLYNIGLVGVPGDVVQARQMIGEGVNSGKMFYLKLGRPNVPTLYGEKTRSAPDYGKIDDLYYTGFPKSDTSASGRKSPTHFVTIFTTGQEVWESMIAAEMLKAHDVTTTVMNVAYFKPWDEECVVQFSEPLGEAHQTQYRHIITAEAHNPETGLGSMIANTLLKKHVPIADILQLGVTGYVPSGSIEAQKRHAGLLGEQIYTAITQKLGLH